jgi:hypothetical protein
MENSHILNIEEQATTPSKHSYEIPQHTIVLKRSVAYMFSLCYDIDKNTDDGKTHYYCGTYHTEKNGAPVFSFLVDAETKKFLGKKTIIENFVLLKPQVIKTMGIFSAKMAREEEDKREARKKREQESGGRPTGLTVEEIINSYKC